MSFFRVLVHFFYSFSFFFFECLCAFLKCGRNVLEWPFGVPFVEWHHSIFGPRLVKMSKKQRTSTMSNDAHAPTPTLQSPKMESVCLPLP